MKPSSSPVVRRASPSWLTFLCAVAGLGILTSTGLLNADPDTPRDLDIVLATRPAGDVAVLTWKSSPGAAYKVQFQTGLTAADWHDYQSVTAIGAETTFEVPLSVAGPGATASRLFFRVAASSFDPATSAPLDPTTFPDLGSATAFLYTGGGAIQTGVTDGTIQPARASVLHGRVLQRGGGALTGVRVSVLDHPEYGQTLSRVDGRYDLAVNGGFELRVNFQKASWFPAQRSTMVLPQAYNTVPDVILVQADSAVTEAPFGTDSTGAVVRGSTQTDSSGSRRATLLVPPGTGASLVLPDGTTQDVSSLHLRATEYTVGSDGPAAMPAPLPPTSGYTYAVELSADEAESAGAKTVQFDRDLLYYVENFIGFPAGIAVPSAFYDRDRAAWIPTPDGRVISIVQIANNLAEVDTDGDGLADADHGASLGITTLERQQLATLYTAGRTLWRVPIRHFSPWDFNYPISPAPGAMPPNQPEPQTGDRKVDDPTPTGGYGVLDTENQVLRESVPVVGSPFTLEYRNDQAAGDPANSRLQVQLSGATVPAPLKGIRLTVEVAGQVITQSFLPLPNQTHVFTWDGLDVYGRRVPGQQTARLTLEYIYDSVYYRPPPGVPVTFSQSSGQRILPVLASRDSYFMSQSFTKTLGSLSRKAHGLGGWGLSPHHYYDPEGRLLYLGDGRQRSAQSVNLVVKRFAGTLQRFAPLGDEGPAINATLSYPYGTAFGPDGSLYIAEGGNHRVRRITPDGIMHTAAGVGAPTSSGDGGPATGAGVNFPTDVAVGPDGSVYIVEDGHRRVRRIAPDGTISTVAGNGVSPVDNGPNGDGGPATGAKIDAVKVAVTPDGTLYIAGTGNTTGNKIRRVGTDGIITTLAGAGPRGFSGDGGPAAAALLDIPQDIAVGPDGSVFIVDSYNKRIRRVTPDGNISTFAGGGALAAGPAADGVPATDLDGFITGMDVAPDGTVYFVTKAEQFVYRVSPDGLAHFHAGFVHTVLESDVFPDGMPARQAPFTADSITVGPDGALYLASSEGYPNHKILRVSPPLPGFGGSELLIPSADASEVYVFDKNGRHLRTLHALTAATLLEFHYDDAGRLASVQDGDGLITTIEHDAAGKPTGILAPYGQHTTLTTGAGGYLASVTNPAGETTQLSYSGDGLLASVMGPKGDVYSFTYDSFARVLSAADPAGGSTTLVRTGTPGGFDVKATSSLGRVSHYLVETVTGDVRRRAVIYPDGTQMVSLYGVNDGTRTTTLPSGTVLTSVDGPDPRFGIQSPVPRSLTVRTPAGLTNTMNTTRTATLATPDNPLSLSSLTDTAVINGHTTTRTYTASSHTFTATSPAGRSHTSQIDPQGRVLATQRTGLLPVSLSYDAMGRLTGTSTGSGVDLRSLLFSFDSAGRLAHAVNALAQSTDFNFDAADRLTQEHEPGARTSLFGYDADGGMNAVTPPGRPAHRFPRNTVNLAAAYTPPDVDGATDTESYQYNTDRDPASVTRPGGQGITFTYDPAGRPTRTDYPNQEFLNYTYHPASGLLTGISSSDGGAVTFTRDGALPTGISWAGAVTGSVSLGYDTEFRLTTQSVNATAPVQFTYDGDNLLTTAGALSLTWQTQNPLLNTTTLGSVADARSYNSFGEQTGYSATVSGTPVFSYTFVRDTLARITRKTETIGGQTAVYDYTYDEAGRLHEVRANGALTATYSYDLNGNRTGRTTAVQTAAYTYDDRDRLRQSVAGAVTTQFTFTPQGELSSRTVGGTGTVSTFDARGNLRRIILPDATQIDYLVDGLNRRIGKKVNGVLLKGFLYQDPLCPVAELDGSNNVVSRFVYATRANVPEYLLRGGIAYRILCDHLGSPRLVINTSTGAIAQRMDYDEFGRVNADSAPGFQPFGFAGGLYDSDTGLVRLGARDYLPETGQWTARDPIDFEGGQTSLYAYVNNDPVNATDPEGTGPHGNKSASDPNAVTIEPNFETEFELFNFGMFGQKIEVAFGQDARGKSTLQGKVKIVGVSYKGKLSLKGGDPAIQIGSRVAPFFSAAGYYLGGKPGGLAGTATAYATSYLGLKLGEGQAMYLERSGADKYIGGDAVFGGFRSR